MHMLKIKSKNTFFFLRVRVWRIYVQQSRCSKALLKTKNGFQIVIIFIELFYAKQIIVVVLKKRKETSREKILTEKSKVKV